MCAEEDDDDDFFKEFGVEDLDIEQTDAEPPLPVLVNLTTCVCILSTDIGSLSSLASKTFHVRGKCCERFCTSWHPVSMLQIVSTFQQNDLMQCLRHAMWTQKDTW